MVILIGGTRHPRGYYEIPDENGEIVRYPRVTSIINILAKPGLGRWREAQIRQGNDPDAITREAGDRGTAVHKLIETINRGERIRPSPELAPFARAYMDWMAMYVARIEVVERLVVHRGRGYAGQLDFVAILKEPSRRRAIVDVKSGKSVDGRTRLQLIAYQEALEEEMYPDIHTRLVLHMPWDRPGTLNMIEYDAETERRDRLWWRATLRAWKCDRETRDEWKATRG